MGGVRYAPTDLTKMYACWRDPNPPDEHASLRCTRCPVGADVRETGTFSRPKEKLGVGNAGPLATVSSWVQNGVQNGQNVTLARPSTLPYGTHLG